MDGAGLRFLPVHSAGHCTTRSCKIKNGQVNNILLHNVERMRPNWKLSIRLSVCVTFVSHRTLDLQRAKGRH